MNVSSQFVLPWGTFHQITANNTSTTSRQLP